MRKRLQASVSALGAVAGNRELRRLQLALVGSETGTWIVTIALTALSFRQSGLTGFGVVYGLRMLAPAVAAPFLGLLGDRMRRRVVMLGADLSRVLLIGLAATISYLHGPLLALYVLVSLVSVAGTGFRPAQAALVPALARTPDELTASNAASSTIESVSSFVGPAIGGILVASLGAGTTFVIAAATFVWSAMLVVGVHEPNRALDVKPGALSLTAVGHELRVGARSLAGDRTARVVVGLISAQVVVCGALLVYLVGLSFGPLHGGDRQFGILLSALGIGGLLGGVGALGLVGGRLMTSFALATVFWGAPIALLALGSGRLGAFLLVAVIGFANTVVDVAGFTLLQRAVPEDVLGRVFGILESLLYGSTVLGAFAAPALVSWLGLHAALVITGVFLPVLVASLWPVLRTLELQPEPAGERLALLRGVPFLTVLPALVLERLATTLIPITAAAGEALVTQGEPGDLFYLVAQGEISIAVDGNTVGREGPGSFFGEIALLRDAPRTATVTAETAVELFALEREEFLPAVTGHAESASEAETVISTRLRTSRPALFNV